MMKLLSYPRSFLMALAYPFFLVFASAISLTANLLLNNRKVDDAVMAWWGRTSCSMFGVKVRVEGLENIPPGGFLYVFNHTSFFDIFAMAAVLPGMRFGAKIELFKIPVFGHAMKRLGVLPINRGNREQVFEIYREAQDRMKNGERFALAPEGTRQTEEKLAPFKAGPFIFAINTGAPIVPIVIRFASEILPKHHVLPNWGTWSREILVKVLPPVDSSPFQIDERPKLQDKVRAAMAPHFPAS